MSNPLDLHAMKLNPDLLWQFAEGGVRDSEGGYGFPNCGPEMGVYLVKLQRLKLSAPEARIAALTADSALLRTKRDAANAALAHVYERLHDAARADNIPLLCYELTNLPNLPHDVVDAITGLASRALKVCPGPLDPAWRAAEK